MKRNSLFFSSRKLGSGVRIVTALLLVVNSFLPGFQAFATDPTCTSSSEACIGEEGYASLATAISTATNSQTVKVNKDVTIDDTLVLNENKAITLDLQGYTITAGGYAIRVDEGDLTINGNGTIELSSDGSVITVYNGSCTIENGTYIGGNVIYSHGSNSSVLIQTGTFNGTRLGNAAEIHAVHGGTITINDGTFIARKGEDAEGPSKNLKVLYAGGDANACEDTNTDYYEGGTIIVNGGHFEGRLSRSNGGTYNIYGGTFIPTEIAKIGCDYSPCYNGETPIGSGSPTGCHNGEMSDMLPNGYIAQATENEGEWRVVAGYLVTFDINYEGGINPNSQNVVANGTAIEPTPAPSRGEAYTFDGWTLAGQLYIFNTPVVANIELVASWSCANDYHLEGGVCTSDSKMMACLEPNTTSTNYTQTDMIATWDTDHYVQQECDIASCKTDYHLEGGICTSNTVANTACPTLTIANATSVISTYTKTWNGTDWNAAPVWSLDGEECKYECNSNFHDENGGCISNINNTTNCRQEGAPANAIYNVVAGAGTWSGTTQSYIGDVACEWSCELGYNKVGDVCEQVQETYTVIFDTNGGTEKAQMTGLAYNYQLQVPTSVSKTGYTLTGWYDGNTLVEFPYGVTKNVTLKAQWIVNKHIVTFKDGDAILGTGEFEYGTGITFVEPLQNGKIFKGWYPELPSTMPDENVVVSAKWENIPGGTVLETSDGKDVTDSSESGIESYSIVEKDDVKSQNPENTGENNEPQKESVQLQNDSGKKNTTVLGGLDLKIRVMRTGGSTGELENSSIKFKNPYRLEIPVNGLGIVNGSSIRVKVKHGLGSFGFVGLTTSSAATCSGGVATTNAYTGGPLSVVCTATKCYVEIYTCSASQFVAYTQEDDTTNNNPGGGSSSSSSSSSSNNTSNEKDLTADEPTDSETTETNSELTDIKNQSWYDKAGDQKAVLSNGYTRELNNAYQFARRAKITTKSSIDDADMLGGLNRIAMAKMLSQYAVNVLGKTPDTTRQVPNFSDVDSKLNADYENAVTLAYQLGIMGINMPDNKFRPYDGVPRAEFVTALGRMLYGLEDGTDKYYSTHMAKLMKEGIITNTDPAMKELRGYVMLMLMRSVIMDNASGSSGTTGVATDVTSNEGKSSSSAKQQVVRYFTEAYRVGQNYSKIGDLQKLLKSLGYYDGSINNTYDSKTVDAVYDFQIAMGILDANDTKNSARGYLGPTTREALNQKWAEFE